MDTILNEENNFQADESVRISSAPTTKKAKITGILALGFAVLAMVSLFIPFLQALLFWNFLLLSAALGIFGFLEINSGKTWVSNITWIISLVLLLLLFIFAVGSFKNPQSLYFYGAFSIIIPILLTITGLTAKKLAIGKSLSPLIIPLIFVFSTVFFASNTTYLALLILPISWGILGIVIYSDSKSYSR